MRLKGASSSLGQLCNGVSMIECIVCWRRQGGESESSSPAGSSTIPEESHYEEDGVRYRRRSKSAADLDSGSAVRAMLKEELKEGKPTADSTKSPQGSKRSSFEAGLAQDLKAADPSQHPPAEKLQRQLSQRDDFLPAELIQRSHLFNGPS